MPTYQYQCDACDHEFEEMQSIKDEPLVKCPKCKKKKLRRLIGGGAGLIFKGSGFYITDYRSDSYKSAAKAEQESSKSGGESAPKSSGESKAESNGSAKSESGKKPAKSSKSET